jgi:signal transduction histidine kinase
MALVVLIGVQILFIRDTYLTKQRQLDAKYGAIAREALSEFNEKGYDYALDSILFELDNRALDYLFADPDPLTEEPATEFGRILSSYRVPEEYIREYLSLAGEDSSFFYYLLIRQLYLVDMGFEQMVYPDSTGLPAPPHGAILVGSYTQERNFFRVGYDIYINFRNRIRMVLKEMWMILSLSVLTLVLVFAVYFLTLRNMLRQKRLSELKTDFINNMTHELKTPLSTISVASSSLGNRKIIQQEEKVSELSGIIKKQNRHLTELIDRILDINIWEKDQVRIKRQPVRLEPWLFSLADAFRLERSNAQVELGVHINFPQEEVSLDEVHMSTAINNLLSNSVKYGNTPCRITLSADMHDGCLQLAVSDNGPGIPKEDMKHVFEKFYRGRESKERVIRGLGLGLYYVKQIVEAHGGTITVRSVPGTGTEFIINIPCKNGNITS